MKKFLIIANWKANKTVTEAKRWLGGYSQYTKLLRDNADRVKVILAAPYTLLHSFGGSHWDLELASQDVSGQGIGAYTGEVPAKLLVDLEVKYCLIGHSERRRYLHETNIEVEKKMDQAIQSGIIPILCAQNLSEIPENIRNFSADRYLIMYEPFSAISAEGQYHPEDAGKVLAVLADWKNKLNLHCRLLYGGSVNPEYVQQLMISDQQLVSGLVVGHASLEVESFFAIIKKCLQTLPSD